MLGDKKIEKCDNYKYLGDIINRNGKNDENLKERFNKMKASVRAIITCCSSKLMQKIGVRVIHRLYESETIPALLNNAETWTLNKTERNQMDKTEIQALKKMIGVPQTTPTAGVLMTLGTLCASIRVDIRQLLYLHKVLQKEEAHWTRTTLGVAEEYNIGWAKNIKNILETWELEQDWCAIQQKPFILWKKEVKEAAEKKNKERLAQECETKVRGETKEKIKTKFVIDSLKAENFVRKTDKFSEKNPSIVHTRALIMARYGMLKCANNFSTGFGTKNCDVCGVIDNEDHRINYCKKWENINRCCSDEKIDFSDIFLDDYEKCLVVVECVLSIWDLNNGKNEMRCQ